MVSSSNHNHNHHHGRCRCRDLYSAFSYLTKATKSPKILRQNSQNSLTDIGHTATWRCLYPVRINGPIDVARCMHRKNFDLVFRFWHEIEYRYHAEVGLKQKRCLHGDDGLVHDRHIQLYMIFYVFASFFIYLWLSSNKPSLRTVLRETFEDQKITRWPRHQKLWMSLHLVNNGVFLFCFF